MGIISPNRLRLSKCATGQEVLASVEVLSREDAKNFVNAVWWAELGPTLQDPVDEPDRHWDWRQLVSIHQNKPYFRAVCVKTADGAIQAAMLFRVDAKSALDEGERAIHVDRLATAPRNRDWLVSSPAYRRAGGGLLDYATAVSYSLGLSGRVNLYPIAGEEFYVDRGFVPTDATHEDETLFELPATVAMSMLKQRGLIDG